MRWQKEDIGIKYGVGGWMIIKYGSRKVGGKRNEGIR